MSTTQTSTTQTMQHFKHINRAYERIIKPLQGHKQIYKLLQSAPHSLTSELMRECGKSSQVIVNQNFTLKARTGAYDQPELHVIKTKVRVDYKTAITNAFIYASWWGDTDLVKQIVRDHGSIIDVNARVDDKNVLEWTVGHVRGARAHAFRKKYDYRVYEVRNENAIGICRYLLNHYGPKIDANRPGGVVLDSCTRRDSADITAKLVWVYGNKLVNPNGVVHIFRTLIMEGHDDEAELFLRYNREELSSGLHMNAILPATYHGSTRIFKTVLAMFGSKPDVCEANYIFSRLCEGVSHESISDIYPKIRAALDLWARDLTPETIEFCLVNQWDFGQTKRRRPGMGRDHGRACQLIVARCVDQIKDDGIQIALAACIFPSNMKLFDEVFDSNLGEIRARPHLLYHALLECTCFGFEDTRKYIMSRCASRGVDMLSHGTTFEAMCRSDRQKRLTLNERYRDHPIGYSGYSARSYYRMA